MSKLDYFNQMVKLFSLVGKIEVKRLVTKLMLVNTKLQELRKDNRSIYCFRSWSRDEVLAHATGLIKSQLAREAFASMNCF